MATKKANKNVNSKTPTAILQKNILYISFGLPLRPKLHFKIQIPTGLLKGSICSVFEIKLYICNLFSFFGLESTDNLQSLIEKDIFGAMQIPIFYIIKCKFFLKKSAKLHSIWIDCCTAVEKQTWEHEFIYNIALLHTL